MSDPKQELIRDEDEGWAELHSLLDQLGHEGMGRPGLTEDWCVKDMVGHLACWWAEAASRLERMRMGTYEPEKLDIDAMNRRFYESMSDVDAHTVLAEIHASRNRALEELGALHEVTPEAREWFFESGPQHYRDHLPDLRRFVETTTTPS
jgi:hypothetical protein